MTLFDPDALGGPGPDREPEPDRAPPDAERPPGPPAPAARRLTAAQRAAVDQRAHSLLLSASAGSGKTSVLVERFVRAVLDDGTEPARILAITFTDKAAGELRERIRRRFAQLGEREAARATEAAFVSTIHGFCSRLLRAHPLAAGLDPAFAVLDEPRAARLRDDAFAAALRRFLADGGREALDLAAAYRPDGLAAMVLGAYDSLRSRGQARPRLPRVARRPPPDAERTALAAAHAAFAAELGEAKAAGRLVESAREALDRCARFLEDVEAGVVPWPGRVRALEVACGRAAALDTPACHAYVEARDAFERACADHHAALHVELLDTLLAGYGEAYAAAKAARGALDFDDLELRARDLLRDRPSVRAAWSERFDLLMVDEFQDTNPRQLELLEALERDDLFCVGDEWQAIYGFRHADVELFRARRDALAPRGLALRLEESFRSRPAIVGAVNAAFRARFGDRFAPLVSPHPPEDDAEPAVELLVTDARGWDGGGDAEPVDLGDSLPPGPAWRRAEARLLAQRLRELVDAGEASPGQVAVLVRASGSMPIVERALADVGLPSLASAGRGFWTRQEVVDLMAYLAVVANPLDERALLTVLGSPLCGLSSDGMALAVGAAREQEETLWRALREPGEWLASLPAGEAERLTAFADRLAAERAAAPRYALDELLDRAIAASGYDAWILGLLGGVRRMANVDKLLRLARAFEQAEGRDLRGFVDHAAMLEQAQKREPEAAVDDPDVDAVRLMTVHAAKGLEFDVVAVADLGRRPNLTNPSLLVDGERVGLRLSLLDGSRSTPALAFTELDEEAKARAAAEEDRILYVALTRARRRLLLSGAAERWTDGQSAPPLAWLGPALVGDLVERWGAADAATAVATVERPGFAVRLTLSSPATLGQALRPSFAAPAPPSAPSEAAPQGAVARPPTAGPGAGADAGSASAGADAPGAISHTALTAHRRCGYGFYARQVLGLPEQEPPPGAPPAAGTGGLDARVRGIVVHALLAELDLAAPAVPAPDRIRALARAQGASARADDVAAVQSLVAAFAASPTGRRLAAARRVRREHALAFELRPGTGPLLVGAIDALGVEDDGTWLVVDFKTDRLAEADADLEQLVERDYGIQRRLYALAALRAGAPGVEVVHVYLQDPRRAPSAAFTAAHEPALTEELGRLAGPLARGEYPLTESPHAELCGTCPARGGLCPYPPELTDRTWRSAPAQDG